MARPYFRSMHSCAPHTLHPAGASQACICAAALLQDVKLKEDENMTQSSEGSEQWRAMCHRCHLAADERYALRWPSQQRSGSN